jgi:hypothetical protein
MTESLSIELTNVDSQMFCEKKQKKKNLGKSAKNSGYTPSNCRPNTDRPAALTHRAAQRRPTYPQGHHTSTAKVSGISQATYHE